MSITTVKRKRQSGPPCLKPLITLNHPLAFLFTKIIVVKGAPRLGVARFHPLMPRLKAGDAPS